MKTDLKFIFDIIDGQILGYEKDLEDDPFGIGYGNAYKIDALDELKNTLKNFIKEVNKL